MLGAAIKRPGIATLPSLAKEPDPITWLADNIAVKFNGEIMTIGLEGDDPTEIIKLVNAVTDSYLYEVVNREHDQKLARFSQLKDLVADYREDLKRRREANRTLAQNAGSNDSQTLAFKQQLLLDQMSQTNRQLIEVQARTRESEIQLSLLKPNAVGC